jgi:hypothetical protein
MNQEETSRYSSVEKCDFIVDWNLLENGEVDLSSLISSKQFEIDKSSPFLDSARSASPWRAFYIPFLSNGKCKYEDYVLLKRIQ